MRVLDEVMFAVVHILTPEMVIEKMLQGALEHGTLDIEKIEFGKEFLDELKDAVAYIAGSELQEVPKDLFFPTLGGPR